MMDRFEGAADSGCQQKTYRHLPEMCLEWWCCGAVEVLFGDRLFGSSCTGTSSFDFVIVSDQEENGKVSCPGSLSAISERVFLTAAGGLAVLFGPFAFCALL